MDTIFRPYSQSEALHSDRSSGDRARHRQKIRNAIRDNIADLISEEAIITRDRDKIIRIPIRGMKEYRFVFGDNAPQVGQGSGETKPGDVVGQDAGDGARTPGAGNEPGIDYYETDITLDELIDIMLEDLELPDLERKALRNVVTEQTTRPKGLQRLGPQPHLSRHRSARRRLRRKILADGANRQGQAATLDANPQAHGEAPEQRFPFRAEDLRFQRRRPATRHDSNAVVFCLMDTSGSMDTIKKYLARSFFFLLCHFVSRRYTTVDIVFIAHDSVARKVSEEEFFKKGSSGGTVISSAYLMTHDLIREFYHPSLWNIYIFHCSDGDNFAEDNAAAIAAAKDLCKVANLFGYGEIKPEASSWATGSMLEEFSDIGADNFCTVQIRGKEDVWPAFRDLLKKERTSVSMESG